MENKTITKRIFVGFKQGALTSPLPGNLRKINSSKYIIALRVLGITSYLVLLGKTHINSSSQSFFVALIITLIFTCYLLYLSYNRIKHMRVVLRSEELDIFNSPPSLPKLGDKVADLELSEGSLVLMETLSPNIPIGKGERDKIASFSARAFFCFRGAYDTTKPVALILGFMLGVDKVILNADKAPVFLPFLEGILSSILPQGVANEITNLTNLKK